MLEILACFGEAAVCMVAAVIVTAVTVTTVCLAFGASLKNFLFGSETKC